MTNILKTTSIIFFRYRPKIGLGDAQTKDDVGKFYILLKPQDSEVSSKVSNRAVSILTPDCTTVLICTTGVEITVTVGRPESFAQACSKLTRSYALGIRVCCWTYGHARSTSKEKS